MILTDLATRIGLALALGSAALSVNMASANVSVGTFKEGVDVGHRGGALIAERVYKKVIGQKNCAGLGEYEYALKKVISTVKAPRGSNSQFTAGFFHGYVDAVKQAIQGARKECRAHSYLDGTFPGEFFATIFCQVADQDLAALDSFSFGPIYAGWSASEDVRNTCLLSFESIAAECAPTGIAYELLSAAQSASCAE